MMQVCRELDMTYQTLKFYCNEGLVPNVKRDHNNRRVFDEKDVKWIKDLTCLKKCGMSIQEMKEYLALCLQGESTIMKRKEMLSRKQEMLRESIRELENSIDYIDWKQNFYDEVLSGKRPYVSNLICLKEETD
ncbi:MAG: MerR family transcriptional regulator [Clostridium sp.]|nr:MerR family transcriptional regulator [Clostridium sp.]